MARETLRASMLELLAWVCQHPRTYKETMQAWRSTCPRHSVWEDACAEGLIDVRDDGENLEESAVVLTTRGRYALEKAAAKCAESGDAR